MTQQITITKPDDWHLHVRDGAAMASVVQATAQQFARAIVMPNLRPPVTTAEQAVAYRDRIRAAVPAGLSFEPLMVLYLTDGTDPEDVAKGFALGIVLWELLTGKRLFKGENDLMIAARNGPPPRQCVFGSGRNCAHSPARRLGERRGQPHGGQLSPPRGPRRRGGQRGRVPGDRR